MSIFEPIIVYIDKVVDDLLLKWLIEGISNEKSFNFNFEFEHTFCNVFPQIITTFTFFALSRVPVALLLLGVFITHSGEFTRFLHRIGFTYLIYFI